MKKTNKKLLSITNQVLYGVLAILGFGSCNNGDGPLMYGCPYSIHKINGKVENTSGTGIKGIRIRMIASSDQWIKSDTLLSDITGSFKYQNEATAYTTTTYKIICEDIDGSTNGLYKTDSLNVDFKDAEYTNGSGWFHGEATKDVVIKLNENGK